MADRAWRLIGYIAAMRILAWVVCLLVVYTGPKSGFGQLPVNETSGISFNFRHLSIDQGLSQGMINDMVLDSTGYLWIATKDGLNRYDGSRFKIFRNESSDPNSVSENFISNLHVDSDGRLWVVTQSKGLNLYDPETESFLRINAANSNVSSDFLGILKEDNDGNMLVQTLNEQGYNLISTSQPEASLTLGSLQISPLEIAFPGIWMVGKGRDWTKELDFEASGAAWYALKDTVYRIENPKQRKSRVLRFPITQSKRQLKEDGNKFILSSDHKHAYRVDSLGVVSRFEEGVGDFMPLLRSESLLDLTGRLFFDKENKLWAFDHGLKFLCLNLKDSELSSYDPNWAQLEEGVRNHMGVGLQDNTGNLWIGTGGNGLLQANIETLRFRKLNSDPLNGGHAEKDGRISLFRTVKKTSKGFYDPKAAKDWLNVISRVKANHPNIDLGQNYTHLSQDENGDFWISAIYTKRGIDCILRIDHQTAKVDSVVCGVSPDQARWFGHPIFILSNGNIWFSEKGINGAASLYELNPETGDLNSFEFPVEMKKYQYRLVSDWYEDKERNKLWLATTHGLFCFDKETHDWLSYLHDPYSEVGLTTNMLLSVAQDPIDSNVLWIGTEGAGLNRLEIESGTFTDFTTLEGLPNNVVYAIVPDQENNLWISTNNGLAKFSPKPKPEFFLYNKSDGLPGNEFNRYEYSTTTNGNLYFGGTSGVVHFNPQDFNADRPALKVAINELKILNRSVDFSADQNVLERPIELTERLKFSPDEDMITFGFTMLDFSNPEKQEFKYRLVGYNADWIPSGNQRSATYTNLSPGDYTFQVMGRNSSGVWSVEPTSIDIEVAPPWNATWWFRSLLVILFFSITYLFYRYRLHQLLRIERIRNRIAQDLHDDIGSTLSSVSLFSSVLKEKLVEPDERSMALLNKIASSTTEMMESMNDMVWTIKSDNDRFEHVINRMRAFAVNLCEAEGLKLHFKADNSADDLNLDMQLRKNIYLIFKEAVNNSVKYANASNMYVWIEISDSDLHITIEDDGTGFDQTIASTDSLNLGGNGLKGMRRRANEINAALNINSDHGTVVDIRVKL